MYKRLTAEKAFAEIGRLEEEQAPGAVVNIAERLWAGCAPDDAFRENVRAALEAPVFRSGYRPGMVDVVFPGDLCICAVERAHSDIGDRILAAAQDYLQGRGIDARAVSSDFLLPDMAERKVYKIGSYGVVPVNGMWETTVHIYIQADMGIIEAFRREPPEMVRRGLGDFGVSAEELLEAISAVANL